MTEQAALCLKECRSNLELVKTIIGSEEGSPTKTYEGLGRVHELAIKAIIAEKGGKLPEREKAVTMCQAIGLWDIMPPRLRNHLAEVKDLLEMSGSAEPPPQDRKVSLPSSQDEWQKKLEAAVSFISYVENHVLSCPPVLKGIRVS